MPTEEPHEAHASDTSQTIEDMARGPAERAVLGRSPHASMARIAGFVLGFVLLGGTLFYLLLS